MPPFTQTNSLVESVQKESRHFPPPPMHRPAHIRSMEQYQELYRQSIDDPETFWGKQAESLHWFRCWDHVLQWNCPDAKWFVNGQTNLCYNAVDRLVEAGLGQRTAILWEGEPMPQGKPEVVRLTFADLKRETARIANVLTDLGVRRGDVVTIYMPMIPELAIAMLACARLGATHSIIFGGFSAAAIRDRLEDARSKFVITADGGYRRGSVVPLKENVDLALAGSDLVKKVLVVRRTGQQVNWVQSRDHWWHELAAGASDQFPCQPLDSEDLAFILYTSGSTGKPKGIMHSVGGYMVYTWLTSRYVFDLHSDDPSDIFWCTADIGWVTGHSYVIYGILANGVTSLMYEGAPNFPQPDRFWDIIQRHRVTKFYTAPTAIRAFMKWGDQHPASHDLSSLRILGSVGEPINPEAWVWYHKHIGHGHCPIVDTWWQTETGGHMLTPLPAATICQPGSCTRPFFGVDPAIVDKQGNELPPNAGGLLVIKKPWPGMIRGVVGDRERFIKTYWSPVPGTYFAGDGARRDAEGNFWIMGRVDDVINVSGHRLGTAEVESALVSHPAVAEAAIVGVPHEIKGTAVAAFVTLKSGHRSTAGLKKELIEHVGNEIGAIAKPDQLRFSDALPKTRSGKIMRRLLREFAATGSVQGDTTTLEDMLFASKILADEEE